MTARVCDICSTTFETEKHVKTCSKVCSYKLRQLTRKKLHEPIEKICVTCGLSFFDVSKKKLVKKCETCIYACMVAKRKQNGSYTPTVDQRQARSLAMLEKHRAGNYFSDHSKKLLSEKAKERWQSEKFRQRCKQSNIEKYGVEHWTQTEEAKKVLSERSKKYKASEETKRKMRASAARRIREGRHYSTFVGKGGFREDIGFYVRSKWEANFARYLLYTKQEFQYEIQSFSLADGRTYTPDFKVGNIFYEIKGWWTKLAAEKHRSFCQEYPNVVLQIVDPVWYSELSRQYASIIPNWEK